VRFLIEVLRTEDDRVEGVVTREGGETPVRFSGWLELMHVLEPAAADDRRNAERGRQHPVPKD
jgi:hypothetical protein